MKSIVDLVVLLYGDVEADSNGLGNGANDYYCEKLCVGSRAEYGLPRREGRVGRSSF